MKKYLSSPHCGLYAMTRLGDALDEAPHPYTIGELIKITGVTRSQAYSFLARNIKSGRIRSRTIQRVGQSGKPATEYWRGTNSIMDTFGEAGDMDDETAERITQGKRPVSWRDDQRTSWSVDANETITAMRGNNTIRLGRMESASMTESSIILRVQGGPSVSFERKRRQ